MTSLDDHDESAPAGNGTLAAHGVLAKFSWAYRSEPGPVRDTNEDFAGVFAATTPDDSWDRGPLFVVADGMGGHAAGEVASSLAVQTALESWSAGSPGPPQQAVRAVLRASNVAVFDAAVTPGQRGMGTTIVGVTLAGSDAIIGHVGDSRAYLIRGEECTQLTADHSRVGEMLRMRLLSPEEAARHPARSQLTRSLGFEHSVQVDMTRAAIEEGDVLVLCTDGLWDQVSRAELAEAANEPGRPAAAELADTLVELATKRGAPDNVTVVAVLVTKLPIPAASDRRFFRRGRG